MAGFHLTAQQKSEPPKELRLNNADEHVTAHRAEDDDFDSRVDAQKHDADAYCARVDMVNSEAMRSMTCASTHVAQCLVSYIESKITLGILGATRFMPKILEKIPNLGNKYEIMLLTLFCNFFGVPVHLEMCFDDAKLKATTGSDSLHAMDRAITNFILNLHFVQRLSLEYNVDIHNHVSDFFSWKGGIVGMTEEDIAKRDVALIEKAGRRNAEHMNNVLRERRRENENGTLMQSTTCAERKYVMVREDGTCADHQECSKCNASHYNYAPLEVLRSKNWYQCKHCCCMRIIDNFADGAKVLCRDGFKKEGCRIRRRRTNWEGGILTRRFGGDLLDVVVQ